MKTPYIDTLTTVRLRLSSFTAGATALHIVTTHGMNYYSIILEWLVKLGHKTASPYPFGFKMLGWMRSNGRESCTQFRWEAWWQCSRDSSNWVLQPNSIWGGYHEAWTTWSTIIPSYWPKENPIEYTQPWFDRIHLLREYPANIALCNPAVCRLNDPIVSYRDAYYYNKDFDDREVRAICPAHEDISKREQLWWTAAK